MTKWQNGSYSRADMEAMQRDAMERVRQMQRRADESLRRSNGNGNGNSNPSPPQQTNPAPAPAPNISPPPMQSPQVQPAPPPPSPPQNNHSSPTPLNVGGRLGQLLSVAGMDQDRLIILGLLFILYTDENTDQLLLLALLYLLF